jgi:threonine synthase
MVKDAFADKELNAKTFLTSANSINVARWLPQQFYYFYAYQQWQSDQPPVIAVPSGNFGNISAGLLASLSGLPVKHFIAACNVNDMASHYLNTGELRPKNSTPTLSNAMDVGNPSNFVRILNLFNHQYLALKNVMSSSSITDEETVQTMKAVKKEFNYLLDPHGAVGYSALKRYLAQEIDDKGFFLETAHPVKFNVEKITGEKIDLPAPVQQLLSRKKNGIRLKADAAQLKEYLFSR